MQYGRVRKYEEEEEVEEDLYVVLVFCSFFLSSLTVSWLLYLCFHSFIGDLIYRVHTNTRIINNIFYFFIYFILFYYMCT